MAALKRFSIMVLWAALVFGAASQADAQWSVCNPFSGCTPDVGQSERIEICDQYVDPMFEIIWGPAPEGPGCTSSVAKVNYYTKVEQWVGWFEPQDGFWRSDVADMYLKFGFGEPIVYEMRYGSYTRMSVAFPFADFRPAPVGYSAFVARKYPSPIIANAQSIALRQGACIAKIHPAVPPRIAKLNADNCKED